MPSAKLDTEEALRTYEGDVERAARALGLSRNGLYARIDSFRINLASFRQSTVPSVPRVPTVPSGQNVSSVPRVPSLVVYKPLRAMAAAVENRGRVPGMEATAENEAPIKGGQPRSQTFRLRPDLRDRLRAVRILLSAKYMIDYDDADVLDQLVEDTLDGWAKKLLEAKPAATAPNGKKKSGPA